MDIDSDTPHPIAVEIAEALRRQHVARVTSPRRPQQASVEEVVDQAFREYWLTKLQECRR